MSINGQLDKNLEFRF